MCGSTTVTYVCVCVLTHVHIQSLAGGHVGLCLPYGSPIELKSHQPGQQAHLPWSHLVNTFFYLSEAEACPFGYTASQQAPGICLSLLTSWVKSAHCYVWFLYVLGIQSLHFTHYAISPALLKPNLLRFRSACIIHDLLVTEKQRNPKESWLFTLFGISCYGNINRHNSFLPKILF